MAIEQHPLPQDVTGYRFRLIGDMTLKQFLYLIAAVLITLLVHNLPLPFFFRYPLEIVLLLLGIGLAFVPIEGRPLDKWLIAFIKSIYSPTQYVWQKQKPAIVSTPTKTTPQPKPSISTPTKPKSTSPSFTLPSKHPLKSPSVPSTPTKTLPKTPSQPKPTPVSSTPPVSVPSTTSPTPPKIKPVHPVSTPTPNPKKTSSTSQTPTTNLPIPFTPTTPNTLVGLTLTPDNHILDTALIEIIHNGLTVRATKSNKLGQFLFAKPLEDGLYQIKSEKPGFKFNIYSLKLEGNIIKPLKIQAQSTTNEPSQS